MLHLNGYNSFSVLWISYPVTRDVSILEEVVVTFGWNIISFSYHWSGRLKKGKTTTPKEKTTKEKTNQKMKEM